MKKLLGIVVVEFKDYCPIDCWRTRARLEHREIKNYKIFQRNQPL